MESIRCISCKYYLSDLKCAAFERIPDSILSEENDHSKPLPEQIDDIVYEERN